MKVLSVLQKKSHETGEIEEEQIRFYEPYGAVGSPNWEWKKDTPVAELVMHLANPDDFGKFRSGQEFYLDFTPCEDPGAFPIRIR